MIIGHMPAGFLVSYILLRRHRSQSAYMILLLAGLFASIAPDLDLFYHHIVDDRQHGHHGYWTHIPIFWLSIYLVLFFPVRHCWKQQGPLSLHVMFFAVMSHMLLDSVTSGIKWLYPFDNHYYGLWRLWLIPDRHDWWVWNYIWHWTFLYELTILTACLMVIWRDRLLRINTWMIFKKYWRRGFIIYLFDKRKTAGMRDADNQS